MCVLLLMWWRVAAGMPACVPLTPSTTHPSATRPSRRGTSTWEARCAPGGCSSSSSGAAAAVHAPFSLLGVAQCLLAGQIAWDAKCSSVHASQHAACVSSLMQMDDITVVVSYVTLPAAKL